MRDAPQNLPDDIQQLIANSDALDQFKQSVAEEAVEWLAAAYEDLAAGRTPHIVEEAFEELVLSRLAVLERRGIAERFIDAAGETRWRLCRQICRRQGRTRTATRKKRT